MTRRLFFGDTTLTVTRHRGWLRLRQQAALASIHPLPIITSRTTTTNTTTNTNHINHNHSHDHNRSTRNDDNNDIDEDDADPDDNERIFDDNLNDNDALSFDEMIYKLRKNEIVILRLGWTNSNYFAEHTNGTTGMNHHHHHTSPYHSGSSNSSSTGSNMNLTVFERALRNNESVRSICLGWRLSPHHLVRILKTISHHGTPLIHQLRHLKIVVLGNEVCTNMMMPDSILTDLFKCQQKLRTIDLRSVQVTKGPMPITSITTNNNTNTGRSEQNTQIYATTGTRSKVKAMSRTIKKHKLYSPPQLPGSVITNCIVQQYHTLSRLKSLSLVDCNVTNDIAIELAQFIHIRGGIAELSLRNNRTLSLSFNDGKNNGLRMICQAPIMRKLDLSLCDLDDIDIVTVANGIASRMYPIGEIILNGNYRMDYNGIQALLQPKCCENMVALNVSYCSIASDRLITLLNTLSQLQPHNTLLRRVILCGSVVSNDTVLLALKNLLLSDCPIRSLQIHDPKEPKSISMRQLRVIAESMKYNYEIEELILDYEKQHVDLNTLNDLNFYLQLNQIGRRIVRNVQQQQRASQAIIKSQAFVHPHLHRPLRRLLQNNNYSNNGSYTSSIDDWYKVLEQAGKVNNLDVLHWMVRHSFVNYFHNKK